MADSTQATVFPATPSPRVGSRAKKSSGPDFRAYQELKIAIHGELLHLLDLEKIASASDDRTRRQALSVIQDLVAQLKTPLSALERDQLSLEILDEVFGLGPIEPLLQDPDINDIMVN